MSNKIKNLEIIKLLIQKKEININIEDSQKKKQIDYSSNPEIKRLLSKWFFIHYKIAFNKGSKTYICFVIIETNC